MSSEQGGAGLPRRFARTYPRRASIGALRWCLPATAVLAGKRVLRANECCARASDRDRLYDRARLVSPAREAALGACHPQHARAAIRSKTSAAAVGSRAKHVGRVQLRPVRCSCTPAAMPQCLAARRTRLITSKTSASVEASRARFVERSVVQTRWLRSGSRRANRRSQCNGLAAAAAHGRTGAAHSVPGRESAGRRRRCDRPLRPFAPGAATRALRRWRPRCGQGRCPCPSSAANASCRPAESGSATSASSTYRGPCPSPSTRGPSRCSTRARCCRPRWPPRRCIGPREWGSSWPTSRSLRMRSITAPVSSTSTRSAGPTRAGRCRARATTPRASPTTRWSR